MTSRIDRLRKRRKLRKWRVRLDFGFDIDMIKDLLPIETPDLAEFLKGYVQDEIDRQSKVGSIANSYAHAFVNDVDFEEMAEDILKTETETEG